MPVVFAFVDLSMDGGAISLCAHVLTASNWKSQAEENLLNNLPSKISNSSPVFQSTPSSNEVRVRNKKKCKCGSPFHARTDNQDCTWPLLFNHKANKRDTLNAYRLTLKLNAYGKRQAEENSVDLQGDSKKTKSSPTFHGTPDTSKSSITVTENVILI